VTTGLSYYEWKEIPKMIAKLLFGGAIVLSAMVGVAAPASADNPSQPGNDPNPFAALTAGAPRTTPPGPGVTQELNQGILAALAH
jgi:hypothetical protein